MQHNALMELYVDELKDLYDAEHRILKALPKMVKAASHEQLKDAFESHLQETENHVTRLEQVFGSVGEKARSKKCKAMQGLVEEGEDVIDEELGDAALICAAQKVEHYEIASYGSLQSWAELLEENEAAELLQETLDEEKATDDKLTQTAENAINIEEEQEGEEEQEQTTSSRSRSR